MMLGLAVPQTRFCINQFSHTKPITCVLYLRIEIILICWQVAQVLLTLPYSFSQMGMASGVILQIFYGFMGSWTAYLISVLYVEYRSRKEKQNVNFNNHVIQVTLSKLSYRFSISTVIISLVYTRPS